MRVWKPHTRQGRLRRHQCEPGRQNNERRFRETLETPKSRIAEEPSKRRGVPVVGLVFGGDGGRRGVAERGFIVAAGEELVEGEGRFAPGE